MKTLVLHSGGMDSTLSLLLARHRGIEAVSLGFRYGQRHSLELKQAAAICDRYAIERIVVDIPHHPGWEESSLLDHSRSITIGALPNSFVPGRNGLFLLYGAPIAKKIGAASLTIGVMEEDNSGYPDCSRAYIDAVIEVVRRDLQDPLFTIETPLISMTKYETLCLADELGFLPLLLEETVSCYEGIMYAGCNNCPACLLRNEAIRTFFRGKPLPALYQSLATD